MPRRLVVAVLAALCVAAAPGAALAAPAPGADGLGDPYFPLDGNGGYDTRHYDLHLDYDPGSDTLDGVATIWAKATQDLSSFNLDLVGMDVASIRVNGGAATYTRDAHELVVTPKAALREGAWFVVRVAYSGVPQPDDDPALGIGGWINTDDGTVVAGEPHGAAYWYPVNDHPLDKATYRFEVTVPRGVEAIANGELRSRRTRDGFTTWVWRAPEPMASYLTTVDIGQFDVKRYRQAGVRYLDAIDPDLFETPKPRTGRRFAISQIAQPSYKRLTRTITVPSLDTTLSFWVTRDTEQDWDYFAVEARPVGTEAWTTLPDANGHTDTSTGRVCPYWLGLHPFLAHYQTDNGDGTCTPTGTTGEWNAASGRSDGYEQWSVDLSQFAGLQVELSLSAISDDQVQLGGVYVDDVEVSTGEGSTSFEADGNPLDGWTVAGPPASSGPNENDWIATSKDTGPSVGTMAAAAFAREPDAIAFLSDLFGPYPFSTAGGITDDDETITFALETQTRPYYGPDFFWDRTTVDDFVIVHELAHQWTGDYLALAAWQHIWLNEGWASYTEWLWSEQQGGPTVADIAAQVASIPADDPFWSLTIGDPGPTLLFDDAVYARGALTLYALQQAIGDAAFNELAREWVARNAGGNVTTADFQALAEELSGQDLDALFQEYLFTPAKPASLQTPVAARSARASEAAAFLRRTQATTRR